MESIIIGHTLVVFAITLTITKANIFHAKRKFVDERYKFAVENGNSNFIHRLWHAWWTCPMCLGFWVALATSPFFIYFGIIWDTLIVYGLNWILHCIEDFLVTNSREKDTKSSN